MSPIAAQRIWPLEAGPNALAGVARSMPRIGNGQSAGNADYFTTRRSSIFQIDFHA